MKPTRVFLSAASCMLALLMPVLGHTAEDVMKLKDAPGRDLLESQCVLCHSLDYVLMNSPFLDRKGWEASVNKMIKMMGAPINEADAKTIVDYLESQYGKR